MKALVISLNFNPGHVSHMVASCKQCEELGYECAYYANPAFKAFLPEESVVYTSEAERPLVDLAIFLFPSQKNLSAIRRMKREGAKVVYIFHEPLARMKLYRQAGFSWKYLAKLSIIDRVNALTVKWSDVILLPSRKAVDYYEANRHYRNKRYHYMPLMYSDERLERHIDMPRRYFSYIGTVAADHSFREYLDFIEWAIMNGRLEGISFLIATKSDFDIPEVIAQSERVTVRKGVPLSDEEINDCYASSVAVWNAYARTTQSGVLAKAFMFGTPALVMRCNLNEFTRDNDNVVAIDDNSDPLLIENAVMKISDNFNEFSSNCRRQFESSFYYGVYNEEFKSLIEGRAE